LALLLPVDEALVKSPDEALDLVDALVLTGGADIGPLAYGAEPHPETRPGYRPRDAVEIALARRALERDLPVLGICRGMQVLNVATGGTLAQHVPGQLGHSRHRRTPGTFAEHEVRLAPGSLAAFAASGQRDPVKSHHHQGLGRLGQGVVATGWSTGDGVTEAIELPGHRFALGVLSHPEEDERSALIAALVAHARGRTRTEAA
jgi:putative glutamine amidotransferase